VTDAAGDRVPASMAAVAHGEAIAISVSDAGARYPLTIDPTLTQVGEINSPSGAINFGYAVAISGTTAMVGAPDVTYDGNNGAVYVFTEQGNGTWTAAQTIVAGDGQPGDEFGYAVALSGSTAMITAPEADGGDGTVYVYTYSGTWSVAQEIECPDQGGGDGFGNAVALSGSGIGAIALIGAFLYNGDEGSAYVYTWGAGSWSEDQQLTPADGNFDQFGYSVAMSGTSFLIGATTADATLQSGGAAQAGAVYVFECPPRPPSPPPAHACCQKPLLSAYPSTCAPSWMPATRAWSRSPQTSSRRRARRCGWPFRQAPARRKQVRLFGHVLAVTGDRGTKTYGVPCQGPRRGVCPRQPPSPAATGRLGDDRCAHLWSPNSLGALAG